MTMQQVGIDRATRILEAVKRDLAEAENLPTGEPRDAKVAQLTDQLAKREKILSDLLHTN